MLSKTTADALYTARTLATYKKLFDDAIDAYWHEALPDIQRQYGSASTEALQAFAGIMQRGGKRIRGTLGAVAYRMFGGADDEVVRRMGIVLEMVHAYLLIIDDICDQSDLRRGGMAAHKILEQWHAQGGLHGQSQHFGATMATLAAMTGAHQAMLEAAQLPVAERYRVAALENLNHFLVITCHGQINDVMNEVSSTTDQAAVENVLLWKTAYYSFANPLQFGALLGGAPQEALDVLLEYSLAAGRAFQISDDILGTFGQAATTGKNPADDVREGKRTLLVLKALELAPPKGAAFLEAQLGNRDLTPAAFQRCRDIMQGSGALDYARQELAESCEKAATIARSDVLPTEEGKQFLAGLALSLAARTA